MIVAYLGDFTRPWTTEQYIARALERAGCQVLRFDEKAGSPPMPDECWDVFLFAKCKRRDGEWPIEHAETVTKSVRAYTDAKIVCWLFDLLNPHYSTERYQWASAVSGMVDLFCTTDGSVVDFLDNAKLLRQGIGDDRRPGVYSDKYACDALWLGGTYGERGEFVEALQQRLWRRLWVLESGARGDMLNDVMASAKVVIGPHWPAYPGYWSNRLYVAAGYGGCLLMPDVAGMAEEGWRHGENFWACSSTVESVIDAVDILTGSEGMLYRNTIKRNGRDWVAACHTYDNRVKQLLEWVA